MKTVNDYHGLTDSDRIENAMRNCTDITHGRENNGNKQTCNSGKGCYCI